METKMTATLSTRVCAWDDVDVDDDRPPWVRVCPKMCVTCADDFQQQLAIISDCVCGVFAVGDGGGGGKR